SIRWYRPPGPRRTGQLPRAAGRAHPAKAGFARPHQPPTTEPPRPSETPATPWSLLVVRCPQCPHRDLSRPNPALTRLATLLFDGDSVPGYHRAQGLHLVMHEFAEPVGAPGDEPDLLGLCQLLADPLLAQHRRDLRAEAVNDRPRRAGG